MDVVLNATNHDAAGRMTDRLEPDTGPAYFAYDAAGNRTVMQDGSGATYWTCDRAEARG